MLGMTAQPTALSVPCRRQIPYNNALPLPPTYTLSMDTNALTDTLARIEVDPRSGQSLLLYALVKTLTIPQAGHSYLLTKLKEMNADTRQLAYGLMEMMASGQLNGPAVEALIARMDNAIRG